MVLFHFDYLYYGEMSGNNNKLDVQRSLLKQYNFYKVICV